MNESRVATQPGAGGGDKGSMQRSILSLFAILTLWACKFPPPPDVEPADGGVDAASASGRIGGTLSGMWQGGVARLHLVSGNVDEILDVDTSGAFQFLGAVDTGETYEVTVSQAPMRHRCTVELGTGTVPAAGIDDVAVRCTIDVPLTISTSLPFDWTFDVATSDYSFDTSLLVQGLTVRVDLLDATAITVNGTSTASGVTSSEIRLAPGSNDVAIAVHVGALSNTYHLVIDRGAEPIAQVAYGKASNADANDALGRRWGFFGMGAASVAIDGTTLVAGAAAESSGVGQPPNSNAVLGAGAAYVFERTGTHWRQVQMLKAPNAEEGDGLGGAVAISGDFIAVGAWAEDSGTRTINGDQASNAAQQAGAVYVYRRVGNGWVFDAYIKAPNADAGDAFGSAVGIDGNTLVVGAPLESGGANGTLADNSVGGCGAAYVFVRDGSGWSFQTRLKPAVAKQNMYFALTVDIEGDRIAIGADREGSAATTINGDQVNQAAPAAGAAYVFRRVGTTWSQEAYVKAPNAEAGDYFGHSVEMTGQRLVVFAAGEDSAAVGVGGNMADNSATSSGASYVFSRVTGAWQFEAYIKTTNAEAGDAELGRNPRYGLRGDLLAIGMELEDGNARGIDGDQTNNSSSDSGAVYLYHHDGASWRARGYLKSSNSDAGDLFGAGAVLSRDGLVVVAPLEDSAATTIDGDQASNAAQNSGAFYVFR